MNACHFKGFLPRAIELKKTKSTDKSVVNFSIGVKKFFGDGQSSLTWLKMEAWEGVADELAKGGYKGRHILIECEAKNHEWESKDSNGNITVKKDTRFRVYRFEWVSFQGANSNGNVVKNRNDVPFEDDDDLNEETDIDEVEEENEFSF